MPEPLPISREIAAAIADGDYLRHHERSAKIIDARIRPLVEALRICRFFLSCAGASKEEQSLFQQAVEIADAALQAAGADNSA